MFCVLLTWKIRASCLSAISLAITYMGNASIIISTDAESMFQKMARNNKGPSHFQIFIGKEISVDLSVVVPHDKVIYHVGIHILS